MKPIEKLLDQVEWVKAKDTPVEGVSGLPHVTHSGVLNIGGIELECHQLSDGRRIFTEESIEELLPGFKDLMEEMI